CCAAWSRPASSDGSRSRASTTTDRARPVPTVPVEPPLSIWGFPPVDDADPDGLVGDRADLEPGTILAAYRQGLFRMPVGRTGQRGWWSPAPRGVPPLDGLRVRRSLRQSCRRYEGRVDTAFEQVIRSCADPQRPHGWSTEEIIL